MASKAFYSSVLILLLGFLVLTEGCIEDNCTSVRCQNEGVCVQGVCSCLQGYEGDECDIQWYEKFQGAWTIAEIDRKGTVLKEYAIKVISAGSPDTLLLLNLGDEVDTVKCSRRAYHMFSIPEKDIVEGSRLSGGEAEIYDDGKSLKGIYSTVKNDVTTTVSFRGNR